MTMKIEQQVLNKIRKDVYRRSVKSALVEMPKMGDAEQEYDYQICLSGLDANDKTIFVVSKKLKYHNQSLKDTEYGVYPYDRRGNFIKDYDIKNNCGGKFFKNLKRIA